MKIQLVITFYFFLSHYKYGYDIRTSDTHLESLKILFFSFWSRHDRAFLYPYDLSIRLSATSSDL
jgi:hypothetical protein